MLLRAPAVQEKRYPSGTLPIADAVEVAIAPRGAEAMTRVLVVTLPIDRVLFSHLLMKWPDLTAAGADSGIVQGYVTGSSSVSCVVDRLTGEFTIWEIDADPTTIQGMANTIAQNVQAQMGAAGTAQGHHSLNMNQQINWVVAYGLFAVTPDNQGLVYAYTPRWRAASGVQRALARSIDMLTGCP